MVNSSKDIQLLELKDMISQLNITIKTLNDTIARQQSENDELKAQLAWFRQKFFGSSSEKHAVNIAGQLSLFDNFEEEVPVEVIEPEVVESPKKTRRKRPTLQEQFKDLPARQVIVDTLSDEDKICPECGTEMVPIGTEVIRTEVIYTPPKLEKIEYVATTYGCPACKETEDPQFIKDNGTPALIAGSYVSESLLAHIIYQKYGLYLPLYRQEKDFKQLNAPISRTSMANWIITASLEYSNHCMNTSIVNFWKEILMMDETPCRY